MAAGDKIVIPAQAAAFISLLGHIEKGTGDTLDLPQGQINIGGNGQGYLLTAETTWDPTAPANHDGTVSAMSVGDNVYIYAVQQTTGIAKWLASKNSTVPTGYTALNSRKVGGFHYGRVRVVNSDGVPVDASNVSYGAGWESNVITGILPNSVWDFWNRPTCDPTGMAKINESIWVDIYLVSAAVATTVSNGKLDTGLAQSAFNATPLTGSDWLNAYTFNELSKRQGKRLLSLYEWLQAAEGSPEGNAGDNNNAWSATTNLARTATGTVANAISAKGIVDCVGNVWEWLDEFVTREGSTTAFTWYDVMTGEGVGQLYMQNTNSLGAVIAGGFAASGLNAGSRALHLGDMPWNVIATNGARFACDAL